MALISKDFDWESWSTKVAPYQQTSETPAISPPPKTGPNSATRRPSRSPRPVNGREDNAELDGETLLGPPPRPPPPEIQTLSRSLSRSQESCVSILYQRVSSLLWPLVLALLVGVLGYLVVQNSVSDPLPYEEDCVWDLSSCSSPNRFPLPLPVDERTHENGLNELFPGMLDNLVRARSDVCSNLTVSTREFNEHLAHAYKIFTYFDTKYTKVAFQTDIAIAREQLNFADSQINSLAISYYMVRKAYHTVNATAAKALDDVRLKSHTEFYCYAQPWTLLILGVDAFTWYCAPWEERSRKMEEVRSGIVALEREIQRLEQIKQLVQEVQRILQDLAASFLHWQNEFEMQIRRKVSAVRPEGRLRGWFRQHVVHNRRLEETWSELLISVDKREQTLVIDITTDWCKRSKTHSDKFVPNEDTGRPHLDRDLEAVQG